MTDIRVMAFDYDRVLTDSSLKFDERLVPYFEYLKLKGILIGINTGRRWNYIQHMLEWVDFIIYENGYLLHYKQRIPLYNKKEEETSFKIKNRLKEHGLICIEGEMIVSCPIELMEKLKEIFFNDSIKLVTNIDRVFVLPATIDKGSAMLKFLKMINMNEKNLCVIGDGENDIDMFLVAGYPASIGNSVETLKKISKYVSNKNYSDGTIDVIEHIKNMKFKY